MDKFHPFYGDFPVRYVRHCHFGSHKIPLNPIENHHFPMVFLWFSYGFPIFFMLNPHGFLGLPGLPGLFPPWIAPSPDQTPGILRSGGIWAASGEKKIKHIWFIHVYVWPISGLYIVYTLYMSDHSMLSGISCFFWYPDPTLQIHPILSPISWCSDRVTEWPLYMVLEF